MMIEWSLLPIMCSLSSLLFIKSKAAPPILASSLMMISLPMLLYQPHSSSFYSITHLSQGLTILTLWISALMCIAMITPPSPPLMFNMTSLLALILLLAFSANDLLPFYICFEASLIPTLLLILYGGGQPERLKASTYFVLYTVVISFALLTIIFLSHSSLSTLYLLKPTDLTPSASTITFIAVLLPFLVKVPIYSLHLWLPKAHVEAPVAGSMILAGVLLKLGGYGMIRIIYFLNIFTLSPPLLIISSLAILGSTLTAFICLTQTDMKSLVAYSSVTHMGPLILAIFSSTQTGLKAAAMIMIAHGLSSSALFAMVNILYLNSSSRSLMLNKGITLLSPAFSLLSFLIIISNMSCPPFLNFLSEVLSLGPSLLLTPLFLTPLLLTIFLSGAYNLFLYTNMNHGNYPLSLMPLLPLSPRLMNLLALHLFPLLILPLKCSLIYY